MRKRDLLAVARKACLRAENQREVERDPIAGACCQVEAAACRAKGPIGRRDLPNDWSPPTRLLQRYFQPDTGDRDRAFAERGAHLLSANWMNESDETGVSLPPAVLSEQRLTLLALFYSGIEAGIIKEK